MTKKLDLNESGRIVQSALEAVRRRETLSPKDTLGDHIPEESDREHFRETVVMLVGKRQYKIATEKIPILLYTTLEEIAQTIALFALPGTSVTTKPPKKEPKPPPRKKS